MNSKMLVGGFLGGLVLFVLGWLIYGILFADSMSGMPCMREHDAVLLPWIGIGNLFTGWFIAFIFSKWGSVNSFGSGAMNGAILAVLMAIAWDSLMYGTTTMMDKPVGILMDCVMTAVMWGIASGVIGWWMGRK
jgi:hypothetical protein